jgi:Ti-type conjugative transfer relaxase TraA
MAIYYFRMTPISRGDGRSAVAAAAYRAADQLEDQHYGKTHDYRAKDGVLHTEIIFPRGKAFAWASDRAGLWNAAEAAERQRNARVAREFVVAVPYELSRDQQVVLVREFASSLVERYGTAVDFALHQPSAKGDDRNVHAHVMMTVRALASDGFGAKTDLERENKALLTANLPTTQMQLQVIRQSWATLANQALAQAGHDAQIDHRSHAARGVELVATKHVGVGATKLRRDGHDLERVSLDADHASQNLEIIRRDPGQVLTLVTDEKSVFDRHDVARIVHRLVDGEADFSAAFSCVMASIGVVEVYPEIKDRHGRIVELARYSTPEMLQLEKDLVGRVSRLGERQGSHIDPSIVTAAINQQTASLRQSEAVGLDVKVAAGDITLGERDAQLADVRLSDEQQLVIRHITAGSQIAAVVGIAGAGKSTMLAAANEAWVRAGYTVRGAALAGKAADGLTQSSGIAASTLASWEARWNAGKDLLGPKDVFVIDEAGMIGSWQLARVLEAVDRAGAKIVLVGDDEQLQAIGAGAPFRAIKDTVGAARLGDIRRQRQDWQKTASLAFATHRTAAGLLAYAARSGVQLQPTGDAARSALVQGYLDDLTANPAGSRLAMAHRRADVFALNQAIRSAQQAQGRLPRDGEHSFETRVGLRTFVAGDRLLFLKNTDNVKNGMLGTVTAVTVERITVGLDGGRAVTIDPEAYDAFDYGYAVTIHKAQGATVDRAFVLASSTMDRHLTYVAMTRHKADVHLYADRETFADLAVLSARLSRDGAKEMSVDYLEEFRTRRGLSDVVAYLTKIVAPVIEVAKKVVRSAVDAVTRTTDTKAVDIAAIGKSLDRWLTAEANALTRDAAPDVRKLLATEQTKARAKVDTLSPAARHTLTVLQARDLQVRKDVSGLKGPARAAALAGHLEAETKRTPEQRADLYTAAWLRKIAALRTAYDYHGDRPRPVIQADLRVLAAGLEADVDARAAMLRRTPGDAGDLQVLHSALRQEKSAVALERVIESPVVVQARGFTR